jgi:hypothetical protein
MILFMKQILNFTWADCHLSLIKWLIKKNYRAFMQANATAHTANNSVDTSGEVWWISQELRIVASAITRFNF